MSSPALAPARSVFKRVPHPDAPRTAYAAPGEGMRAAPATGNDRLAQAGAPASEPAAVASFPSGAGRAVYGARSGPNWGALLVVLLVHAGLIGALLTARMVIARKAPPPVLNSFTVLPEPPAPPPPAPEQTPLATQASPPAASVVAPNPLVTTPTASPLAAAPVARLRPVPVAAVAAPVAAPAAAPAAPAPITPPDFSAGQLHNAGPAYPYLSRRAKEEGVVTLRVLVTEDGHAGEVRLEKSSGHERLDKAALATVRRWKFVPARQAGKAVAAWVLVPVTFSLG